MNWTKLHPRATQDHLGFLEYWLLVEDPRPAKEQLHAQYAHGGGWRPFKGFKLNSETKALEYPEDPPISPLWMAKLRDEEIYVYSHAWVMILQPDGTFEVCRMD